MLLLLLFAFVAGAGTAITPCVLPVMPALLSASATGGRRRPVAIVLGLAVTFTISIVALSKLVSGVGIGGGLARSLAVVVLIAFGVVMLVPALAQRVQAPLSRLARFGPKTRGDGFWSGLGVGAALGFVCSPCAGPILSAVTAVSASTGGPTARVVLVAIFYSTGMAGLMLLYGLGGRAVLARIRGTARGHLVERTLGGLMIVTGLVLAFNLDIKLDHALANGTNSSGIVAFLADPTNSLQTSGTVSKELATLRRPSKFATRQNELARTDPGAKLPVLGTAPNFVDTQDWFNTPGDRPLTMMGLRGHVVLIDFWTYTCINCIRTLPFVEGLYKQYHRYGLEVVGVETPEFTFEQEASNVRQAIATDGITYPVVQDNHYGTWDAWGNEYWPADYFVDAKGRVRHTQFGEGDYSKDETVVRELLTAAGARHLPPRMTARALTPSAELGTPETYLNPQRESGFAQPFQSGTSTYRAPSSLSLNEWALNGRWTVGSQSITPATAAGASVEGAVQARDVYLVMTSDGNRPREGRVLINGKPIPAGERGTDVGPGGYFSVRQERLYNLVKLRQDAQFTITVQLLGKGIHAYDFTFG